MATPHEPADSQSNSLQFDRAEFANKSARGTFCRECRRPILDEYYDVNGNVVCAACHASRGRFRSRMFRGLKALLLGSLAAAVGAGIYRMFMVGTGWNFSLVAILVGYMVGGAVKTGSRERGGRVYQFLAVFLTYSALVGMFLPDLWKALASTSKEPAAAKVPVEKKIRDQAKAEPARKADTKPLENSAQPKAEDRAESAASKALVKAEAKSQPAALEVKGRHADSGARPRPRSARGLLHGLYLLGMLLLTLMLMVGLMYAIPVIVGIHSPISLFIFGIALYMAWKVNRAGELTITGPYRVHG